MQEYVVFCRFGQGAPFTLFIRDNFNSAYQDLLLAISRDECIDKEYFVDNDFFDNKYSLHANITYYCIKERTVTKWQKYSEKNISEFQNTKNSKLIDFYDYKITK